MAKLGEGDDRWIVKEREDGRNVNNWHWSETSYTEWAREKLGARFEGVAIGDGTRSAGKLLSLETMKGDVTVQSRKQKRFPLYELELTIRWEGQLFDASGGTAVEGKGRIKVPDLSEETHDDLEMTVLCEEETDAKRPLKELVRKEGGKAVRAACLAFVKELKETVMKGHEPPPQKAPPRERFNAGYVAASAETAKTGAVKVVYSYNPPPHVLYETLLDTQATLPSSLLLRHPPSPIVPYGRESLAGKDADRLSLPPGRPLPSPSLSLKPLPALTPRETRRPRHRSASEASRPPTRACQRRSAAS